MTSVRIINTQIAIFTRNLIERPDTLYYKLLSLTGDFIESPPSFNNLPQEIPADVPRVFSSTKNQDIQFNVSLNRVDLFLNYLEGCNEPNEERRISELAKKLCSHMSKITGISRLGVITTAISTEEKFKNDFISGYFKKIDTEGLDEVEVRTNNKNKKLGKEFNNVKKIAIGEIMSPTFNGKCLWVQIDANNHETLSNDNEWEAVLEHLLSASSARNAREVLSGEGA